VNEENRETPVEGLPGRGAPAGLEMSFPGMPGPEVRYKAALGLLEAGRIDEAEAALKPLLEEYPDHIPGLIALGEVYLHQGRSDEAIEVNDRVIRINPDISTPFVNLGYAFILKGDYDQAVSECDEAIRINSRDTAAYINISLAYLLKEDWAMCRLASEKLLEIAPDSAEAHNNLAVALFRQGHLEQAVAHVEAAAGHGYPVDKDFIQELKQALGGAPSTEA